MADRDYQLIIENFPIGFIYLKTIFDEDGNPYDFIVTDVNLEFEKEFDIKDVFKALENKAGIVVQDQPEENIYPMAISAEGSDQIYVGRIRRDFSLDNGINMWVVADNIRKGAATNTVQIAELLVK